MKLRQYEAALGSYDYALALNADYAEAHANRADALLPQCRYDTALAGYDRALALSPDGPGTWNNRGVALRLGRLDDARESFARAEQLMPRMAEARLNRGLLYLLQQDFAKGWPLFEARKQMPALGEARSFAQPLWTGAEDINGKTVFVYSRRGLGDAVQFHRYAALVQACGAQVVLSVNDPLLPCCKAPYRQYP